MSHRPRTPQERAELYGALARLAGFIVLVIVGAALLAWVALTPIR